MEDYYPDHMDVSYYGDCGSINSRMTDTSLFGRVCDKVTERRAYGHRVYRDQHKAEQTAFRLTKR